ncbi:MAG: ribonuclease [Massilia sp.]
MVLMRTVMAAALLLACAGANARKPQVEGEPGRFDYYAVSLSWSPSFCADHRDPDQCGPGRQLGFVMHGLWPQYEKGYPQSCSRERLPNQVRASYATLFPSPRMIGHEWDKHGTCSGLAADSYFALSARLRDQLVIPAPYQKPAAPLRVTYGEFVQSFQRANPRLAENAVLPFCGDGGRFLRELHACYDKSGQSHSCGASEVKRSANSCRQGSFVLPSVR